MPKTMESYFLRSKRFSVKCETLQAPVEAKEEHPWLPRLHRRASLSTFQRYVLQMLGMTKRMNSTSTVTLNAPVSFMHSPSRMNLSPRKMCCHVARSILLSPPQWRTSIKCTIPLDWSTFSPEDGGCRHRYQLLGPMLGICFLCFVRRLSVFLFIYFCMHVVFFDVVHSH